MNDDYKKQVLELIKNSHLTLIAISLIILFFDFKPDNRKDYNVAINGLKELNKYSHQEKKIIRKRANTIQESISDSIYLSLENSLVFTVSDSFQYNMPAFIKGKTRESKIESISQVLVNFEDNFSFYIPKLFAKDIINVISKDSSLFGKTLMSAKLDFGKYYGKRKIIGFDDIMEERYKKRTLFSRKVRPKLRLIFNDTIKTKTIRFDTLKKDIEPFDKESINLSLELLVQKWPWLLEENPRKAIKELQSELKELKKDMGNISIFGFSINYQIISFGGPIAVILIGLYMLSFLVHFNKIDEEPKLYLPWSPLLNSKLSQSIAFFTILILPIGAPTWFYIKYGVAVSFLPSGINPDVYISSIGVILFLTISIIQILNYIQIIKLKNRLN